MKSSTKILIGVLIAISLALGFFIGISVDYPKTNKSNLSGTIGKMSNYRNVKVTENDIELRSELLANEALLKNYRQFFSFHYTSCIKLCDNIDFAIKASEDVPQFREDYSLEIENVKQFRQTLEQARKDILLALTSLQDLSEVNQNNLAEVINNANIAVAQVKYKQNCILTLVESIEKFISGNNPYGFSDLIKAHDIFAVNQLIIAAATNDKPMMKAYNNKQLLSSEDLKTTCSNEQINTAIQNDYNGLMSDIKDNEQINIVIPEAAQIGNIEQQLGIIILSFEKLNELIMLSSEKLGTTNVQKLGIENMEKMGVILNTEKLGDILNSEKLGVCNNGKLGVCNFEKLNVQNIEKLNIIIP